VFFVNELRGKKITKRRYLGEKSEKIFATRVKFGVFWSVCLNVGSCLGALPLPGAPLLVWLTLVLCLIETIYIVFEVQTFLENSK
jgi:hypothetical protein